MQAFKQRTMIAPRRAGFERLESRALLTAAGYTLSMASALDMLSPASSNPSSMVAVGNEAFFTANDGTHGTQLWKSDGTAAGTEMVTDIAPPSAAPSNLTATGTTLFFNVDQALWKSDGTAAGTTKIADSGGVFASLGDTLFFTVGSGTGQGTELWKSDGTAAGTTELQQFSVGLDPVSAVVGGDLYFSVAGSSSSGMQLWKSDGTAAGTVLVQTQSIYGISSISSMAAVGGELYIAGDQIYSSGGHGLWKSDGSTVNLVIQALPEDPSDVTGVNGAVYFIDHGSLWKTDGTAAGTSQVDPDAPVAAAHLFAAGDTLYVTSSAPQGSNSVLATLDANGDLTSLIPAPGIATIANLIEVGGLVFFTAGDDAASTLWVSDGTPSGTHVVRPLTAGSPMAPTSLTAVGGKLFFAATDGLHGDELWSSDGTAAGTVLLDDINPGGTQVEASASVQFGNATFLVVGSDLWKTDGTSAGSVLLSQTASTDLMPLGGWLYFVADDGLNGNRLWKTDGTLAGTTQVASGNVPANVSSLVEYGGQLYFLAANSRELWTSDGTAAGTSLVQSLPPSGPESIVPNPPKLIAGAGMLLIDLINSVWISQGTAATTAQVYADGSVNGFAPVSGGAVFSTGGGDLVKTDGTAAGTVLLRSFGFENALDSSFSNISNLQAVNGLVVFTARINGDDQKWVTDGTVAGTTMFTPLIADQEYVSAVYQDVLGRAPDSGGLAYWSNLLNQGTVISSVAAAIAHSDEYYASFVIKPDYLKLLGRAADSSGVAYWTGQMDAGVTDQELEADLISSDEFFNAAGGTDADWIDAVFKLLLGRPADAGGVTYWSGQLSGGESLNQAAQGIAGSQENNTQLINDDYFHYLGRAADPAGLSYWLAQFAAGQTNEDLIAGFTGSDEYYQQHTG